MESNRAFGEMLQAAKGMLAGKDPAVIAQRAGVTFDGEAFWVPSMGKTYRIAYPDYACADRPTEWQYLVMLHYLNLADGTPVTGEPMPLAELPGGLVRGTRYDRTMAQALASFLEGKTREQAEAALRKLGGELLPGKADLNGMLPFLPRFPLYVNIWFGDEDFPPSARLLIDRCGAHYLTIEDGVSVGKVTLELLRRT